jgi:hypothetical protein
MTSDLASALTDDYATAPRPSQLEQRNYTIAVKGVLQPADTDDYADVEDDNDDDMDVGQWNQENANETLGART